MTLHDRLRQGINKLIKVSPQKVSINGIEYDALVTPINIDSDFEEGAEVLFSNFKITIPTNKFSKSTFPKKNQSVIFECRSFRITGINHNESRVTLTTTSL